MKKAKISLKRLFLAVIILVMFVCFASCGGSDKPAEADKSAAAQKATVTPESAPVQQEQTVDPAPAQQIQPTEAVPAQNVNTGSTVSTEPVPASKTESASVPAQTVTVTGGSCSVDIISAGLDVDYTGGQVIVVKFKFTNSGSSSTCFGDTAIVEVKQNGQTLNGDGIIMDSSSFGGLSFNFRTPVSNGGSITCVYAYPYSSSDDIDVSVRITTNDNARTTLGSGSATLSIG